MSTLSNIWNHPRTSAAGLLISIVSIAGVLSQQGIKLGSAGTGTVVSLIAAVATALLGLIARDPGTVETPAGLSTPTSKLGAWALIALLLPLPWLCGCSGVTVAQDIVNWTPALQSAVATIDTTASLLDPLAQPIFTAATAGFDVGSSLVVGQAKAYLANPGVGTLAELQMQTAVFAQQVNAAVLQAAKIADKASQQHALAAIQGVATIVTAMLALVASVSSKSAVARMADESPIKLAMVEPYLERDRSVAVVAEHYGVAGSDGVRIADGAEQALTRAGF